LQFASEAYTTTLERMKLGHLAPDLDRAARWERELSREDLHKLAFARLILHQPRWVFLNEAIESLDEDARGLVLDVFGQELAETAIVNIGRADDTHGGFFTRLLRLIEDRDGPCLVTGAAASRPAPIMKRKAPAG
jgi:vitamin B12/bleomycin/antimicrobial peptide transport system ATP-binding/permease protein